MDTLRDYKRTAKALIDITAIALYGVAAVFSSEWQPKTAVELTALPSVAPIARAVLPVARAPEPVASTPDFDAAAAARLPEKLPDNTTVAELRDKFSAASFDMGAVRQGSQSVPRLFAKALPHDFNTLAGGGELKQTFFQMVLPLALKVNEEILADRRQLERLERKISAGRALSGRQQEWLDELAARYDATPNDVAGLLRRVDAISPALALAQSAEESGWGRSRFALKGNALFGQKTWNKGLGIVPKRRDAGSRYEVRSFPVLIDSVRSYAHNLNSHPAYGDFRVQRAEMRARDAALDPYGLVETLTAYSERREQYIQTIQKILRADNLEELENTRLSGRSFKTTQALRVNQR